MLDSPPIADQVEVYFTISPVLYPWFGILIVSEAVLIPDEGQDTFLFEYKGGGGSVLDRHFGRKAPNDHSY